MADSGAWTWAIRAAIAGLVAAAATGCGGGPEFQSEVHPHRVCVDDSVACIAKRQALLRGMMADKQRGWVREVPTADSYAAGVRLFAFKSRKRELNCAELAVGRREADAGPGLLRGAAGRHLTPAQVSRGVMLASEVGKELGGEMRRRRCPA